MLMTRRNASSRKEGTKLGNEAYLQKMFGAYYASENIEVPSLFENREFAFVLWGKRGMFRHKGFTAPDFYRDYMKKFAPMHAYVSSALYERPEHPDMDDKGWLGCDLIFDIDCDHIPTPCKALHDRWACKGCGATGPGEHPDICPECKYPRFDSFTWICDECLEVSKGETIKLVEDFLVPDLGISLSEIELAFSGHRGYHAHIELEDYRQLNQEQRRELIDYIRGTGLSFNVLGFKENSNGIFGFTLNMPSWGGKITRYIERLFLKMDPNELNSIDINTSQKNKLVELRDELLGRIQSNNENWKVRGIGFDTWKTLVEHAIDQIAPDIDIPVSLDTHRLIRLKDSLHGKTGFRVVTLTMNELVEFDPFKDPLVFGSVPTEVITRTQVPTFRIDDQTYGPYPPDAVVSVPANAAIFMLCKDVADIT